MPRIQTKLVKNLTDEEYRACRFLNLRGNGEMHWNLARLRNEKNANARVYMIKEGGKLIAWSLVFGDCAHFYTRSTHRRKGYGTRLVKKVNKEHDRPVVYAHDETAQEFFGAVKDMVRIGD